MDGSSAGGACAIRVPCGAVCASAPAASSETAPAKATDIAKVLIRILTPTQTYRYPTVSDCRGNVNCCRPISGGHGPRIALVGPGSAETGSHFRIML